jgi:hypothetical protein
MTGLTMRGPGQPGGCALEQLYANKIFQECDVVADASWSHPSHVELKFITL